MSSTMSTEIVDKLCPEFPPGPLDHYRRLASFDWRQLKIKFQSEEGLTLKTNIWKRMEADPLFAHAPETLPVDDYRQLTFRRVKRFNEWKIPYLTSVTSGLAFVAGLVMFDSSLLARKTLLSDFIVSNIMGSGTKHHHKTYLDKFRKGEFTGCFCLTEMSHGSNSKGVRTTATYIKETDEFELHTPDFEAAKTWSGNLGETATHASVFAQLYIRDTKSNDLVCQGLHNFIVPIRDPVSLETYPGLVIGDLGEKLGLNGVDNGFMLFDHYRVPRTALLDATGGVDKDGFYVTPYKDPSKRFGASLGNLSSGRVGIVTMATANLHSAVVIGIRYSAARKQFGPEEANGSEIAVIEYQTQKMRLFPFLAASFVLHEFANSLGADLLTFNLAKAAKEDPDVIAAMGREIHGLSCSGKPLASWAARDAIQEVREACGGHGYMRSGNLGRLRNDNDANCTYEGDNNVILQQTSNWLIGVWRSLKENETVLSPFGSIKFFDRRQELISKTVTLKDVTPSPNFLLYILQMLVTRLTHVTHENVMHQVKSGLSDFEARNASQFFLARDLSLAFIQSTALERFIRSIEDQDHSYDEREKAVLKELAYLYGLTCVQSHLPNIAKLQIFQSGDLIGWIQDQLVKTCKQLTPNAVALADVLAPTDFVLNSILGHSSGDIYHQLQKSYYAVPNGFERAKYWPEVTENFRQKINSKL